MPDLNHRKQKIQEKRKKTPWREFLKDVASWRPMTFYKNQGLTSRFPNTPRTKHIVSPKEFENIRDGLLGTFSPSSEHFFENFSKLLENTPLNTTQQLGNNENTDYADMIL